MGKVNKIKIRFELDEDILNGTELSGVEVYNHIAHHLADYLKSKNAKTFSTEELDTIASDVRSLLLEKSDKELYESVLRIVKSSIEEFKGEFGKLLMCVYMNDKKQDEVKELIYTFNSGIEVYKPILIDRIVHNKDIGIRVYNYTYKLKSDVELMLDYMRYVLTDKLDLHDKEKDKLINLINKDSVPAPGHWRINNYWGKEERSK